MRKLVLIQSKGIGENIASLVIHDGSSICRIRGVEHDSLKLLEIVSRPQVGLGSEMAQQNPGFSFMAWICI